MQHTDKYNFSIIEGDDPFSPDPLNQNTQTMVTELTRVDAALAQVNAALEQESATRSSALAQERSAWSAALAQETAARNTALAQESAARNALATTVLQLTYGSYAGDGSASRFIGLPFTPKMIYVGCGPGYIFGNSTYFGGIALLNSPATYSNYTLVTIVTNGFQVYHCANSVSTNSTAHTYRYFAIG